MSRFKVEERALLINDTGGEPMERRYGSFSEGNRRAWEFAGHGTETSLKIEPSDEIQLSNAKFEVSKKKCCGSNNELQGHAAHTQLNQFQATAIAGNDITSSCLYVGQIAVLNGGQYAPICLALVALILFFFRSIYGEVGTALPLNGKSCAIRAATRLSHAHKRISFSSLFSSSDVPLLGRRFLQRSFEQHFQVICLFRCVPHAGLLYCDFGRVRDERHLLRSACVVGAP